MGQKVNPTLQRLGIIKESKSKWHATRNMFAAMLYSDYKIRDFLQKKLGHAGIDSIKIERPAKNAKITIRTARPGVVIGKKGDDIEKLRVQLAKLANGPVHLEIEDVKRPELCAKLVAEGVAQQLERRVLFRRAMKRAVGSAMRLGAQGVKITVSGRLGGAEIARSESHSEGRVPLHTFRADIDYSEARAQTTYGIIGVKVWIFKGEVFSIEGEQAESDESQEPVKSKKSAKKSDEKSSSKRQVNEVADAATKKD